MCSRFINPTQIPLKLIDSLQKKNSTFHLWCDQVFTAAVCPSDSTLTVLLQLLLRYTCGTFSMCGCTVGRMASVHCSVATLWQVAGESSMKEGESCSVSGGQSPVNLDRGRRRGPVFFRVGDLRGRVGTSRLLWATLESPPVDLKPPVLPPLPPWRRPPRLPRLLSCF